MIRAKCAGCGEVYSVSEEFAGRSIRCPCGATFLVPGTPAKPIKPSPDRTQIEGDGASDHQDADNEDARILRDAVKMRVETPAKTNLLLAVLEIMAGAIMVGLSIEEQGPNRLVGFLGAAMVVWYGFIAYGAYELSQLGNYRVARIAAWMALLPFPFPCYPVLFVGAILALRAIDDPTVRASFHRGTSLARTAGAGFTSQPAGLSAAPQAVAAQVPLQDERVVRQVVANPAAALLGCWILVAIFSLAIISVSTGLISGFQQPKEITVPIAVSVVLLVASAIGINGARHMARLQSYRWALASAILLLVLSPFGCFWLPIGVWALVVLLRGEVKQKFAFGGPQPLPVSCDSSQDAIVAEPVSQAAVQSPPDDFDSIISDALSDLQGRQKTSKDRNSPR